STFAVAGAPLAAFTDFVALGPRPLESQSLAIVFGGEVGDSSALIAPEQASGKFVVLRVHGRGLGLRPLRAAPGVPGAAAVALVALDSLAPQVLAFLRRPRTVLDDNPAALAAQPPVFLISGAAAPTRSPTAPTTTAPGPSRRSRSPSESRRSSANRSGPSCSCGTPARRRGCWARATSPTTRPCHATRSWRS